MAEAIERVDRGKERTLDMIPTIAVGILSSAAGARNFVRYERRRAGTQTDCLHVGKEGMTYLPPRGVPRGLTEVNDG